MLDRDGARETPDRRPLHGWNGVAQRLRRAGHDPERNRRGDGRKRAHEAKRAAAALGLLCGKRIGTDGRRRSRIEAPEVYDAAQ